MIKLIKIILLTKFVVIFLAVAFFWLAGSFYLFFFKLILAMILLPVSFFKCR